MSRMDGDAYVYILKCAQFHRMDEAAAFEHQIKKWTRAKKNALIDGNMTELKRLAISKSSPADPAKSNPFKTPR